MTTIFSPTNTASGFEILMNEVAALLKMVDAFDAVAPTKLVSDDLSLLDLDPLLPDDVFSHLKHGHWVLVWMSRIEVIWRRFIELHIPFLPSHSDSDSSLNSED